ncbi:hypothetical protein D3C87_652340 [compost metagenome]
MATMSPALIFFFNTQKAAQLAALSILSHEIPEIAHYPSTISARRSDAISIMRGTISWWETATYKSPI